MKPNSRTLLAASALALAAALGALAFEFGRALPAESAIGPVAAGARPLDPTQGSKLEPRFDSTRAAAAPEARRTPTSSQGLDSFALGEVVDLDGAPVPGVRLVGSGEDRTALASSDENGRFAWPAASRAEVLLVDDPHWLTVLSCDLQSARTARERTVVVARVFTLRGRVLGDGRPLPRARVALAAGLEPLRARFDASLRVVLELPGRNADAEGRFEFEAVPQLAHATLKASHEGFEALSQPLDGAPREPVSVELKALRARFGVVRGEVRRCDGTPADHSVYVTWGANGTRTDRGGRFELPLGDDPGADALRVNARGHVEREVRLALAQATAGPLVLTLGPALEPLRGQLSREALQAPAEVSKSAPKSCWVELYHDEHALAALARTRVGADGRFEFKDLVPGEYWLVARPAQGRAPDRCGPFRTGRASAEASLSF
jgi:hypothetical protein